MTARYDTMTPAEVLRTMGRVMRDLLADLPVEWDEPRPQTRSALVDRGLAKQVERSYIDGGAKVVSRVWLFATARGLEVADLIHADVAEDTWEATR